MEASIRGCEDLGREDLAANTRSNLVAFTLDVMPRASGEHVRSLIELARRTGDRSLLMLNVNNGAEMAIRTGEWDWADRQLAEVLAMDLDPTDRLPYVEQPTILVALRGGDPSALLEEAESIAGDSEELGPIFFDRHAVIAWLAGRYRDAARDWRAYAAWSPLNATLALAKAGRASLWDRDIAAARADLEAHIGTGKHSPAMDAARATLEAGIAALDGAVTTALRRYRDALQGWALRTWACRGMRRSAAWTWRCSWFWRRGRPCRRGAIPRGLRELGARPFLARLDAALDAEPHASPAPPGPAPRLASGTVVG